MASIRCRESGYTAILVLGSLRKSAQPFRRPHALRCCLPRLGMGCRERKFDERVFVVDSRDRRVPTLAIRGAPRYVGADPIGAGAGSKKGRRMRRVIGLRERGSERRGDGE
jgi:hypothetical protein